MLNKDAYIQSLEDTLMKFLEPIKNIPFFTVKKILTGCDVLEFDLDVPPNMQTLGK